VIVYDIQNLVKSYPGQAQPANKNITLQIDEGEIFGILGDNGAGKSTLVRQMVNLLSSDSGAIALFGHNIVEVPHQVQMTVGYMPQESGALNNLTVGEALFFTAHLRGMSRTDARKECAALLDLWQIRELRHQPSSRLSGGQRRLLRLAVAMAGTPPVLILDEPTNDLDPQRRKLVWDILRDINREQGTTIILITHDAIEAEKAIQRVGILLVIPLCVLPLAGLGSLIGANARTPEESGSLSLLMTMVMLFIGPVIIPESRLPDILLLVERLSPATYAASALGQTLVEPMTGQVVVDLAALVGFSLFTFWLVGLKLDWRQR